MTATLSANYNASYLATVTTSGSGKVSVTPTSPTADGYYPSATNLTFTAVPASGYSFAGFSGSLTGPTNPQSITIGKPLDITATFAIPSITTN